MQKRIKANGNWLLDIRMKERKEKNEVKGKSWRCLTNGFAVFEIIKVCAYNVQCVCAQIVRLFP